MKIRALLFAMLLVGLAVPATSTARTDTAFETNQPRFASAANTANPVTASEAPEGNDSDEDELINVTLTIETHASVRAGLNASQLPDRVPGTASCQLTVHNNSSGAEVLDEAVATGCIEEWDYDSFDEGRFVTSIDNLRAPGYTCLAFALGVCDWWEFHVNGTLSAVGLDEYEADEGDTNRWLYRNTFGSDTRPE